MEGVIHMNIKCGLWSEKQRKILVVDKKTNNIMGCGLLAKLEITVNAKNTG